MSDSAKIKILHIDDEPSVHNLIKKLINSVSEGEYLIRWADTLEFGISLAQSEPFDLVILDLGLEKTDGLKTLQSFIQVVTDLPVIILTGADEGLAINALQQGAQDFIRKDKINASMLIRVIQHTLERYALQRKTSQYLEQLKASEQRVQHIIKNNIDGILIVSEEGIVKFVNPAAMQLLNKNETELVGSEFGFPLVLNDNTEIDISTSAEYRTVEMRVIKMSWENKPAFLASLRDITERKKSEEDLISTRNKLEEALDKLKENQKRLIEVESLKSVKQLVGAVSHEFSQPLQALANYLGLIEHNGAQPEYLDKCKKMITKSEILLNDLKNIISLNRKDYLDSEIIDIKASANNGNSVQNKKILIIDDEAIVLDSVLEFLTLSGLNCTGSLNAESAYEKLKSTNFDLIICDVNLPKISGPDFFRIIKKDGYNGKFIFLTGLEMSDEIKDSLNNADGFFSKPVSIDKLKQKILHLLN